MCAAAFGGRSRQEPCAVALHFVFIFSDIEIRFVCTCEIFVCAVLAWNCRLCFDLFTYFGADGVVALVDTLMQHQCAALSGAAVGGHTDCVRLLVEAGADMEAKSHVREESHLYGARVCCCESAKNV